MEYRNYNDPQYKKWRMAVYRRDKFTCKMCKIKKKKFNAHHLKKWSEYPELRFKKFNGITLCWECHNKVTGHELEYESFLRNLILGVPEVYDKHDIMLMIRKENNEDSN